MVVSSVNEDNGRLKRRDEIWTIKRSGFTPKEIDTLNRLAALDSGDSALIVSITPLV